MKLLEVENLTVQYPGSANPACKVSFQVESGELLGIAGASGAGKSTAMLALMGILPEQVQITSEKLKQHGTKAMIFQDASASLNPLVRVGSSSQRPFWHIRGVPEKKPESGQKHFWMKWEFKIPGRE